MVRLDVGDDRDDRRQLQEGPVVLVGFGDEVVALAQPRVGPEDVDLAADDDRRVEAGLGQDHARQRRRRRLAVGAGDGDSLLQAHDLAEHLGPADDRDAPRPGGGDLGVRLGHGRGDDEQVRVFDVRRVVPDRDLRPEGLEPLRVLGAREVAARDLERRGLQEDLGDAAHADAPGPDEVEAPQPQEPHRAASALEDQLHQLPGGVGLAERLRLLSHRGRACAGPSAESATPPARFSAVRSFSSMTAAAPASVRGPGRSPSGGPAAAAPKGTRIAGRPAAASSETVIAPARQTTRSAQAISSQSFGRNGTSFHCAGIARVALARGGQVLLAGLVDRPRCPIFSRSDRGPRHRAVDDARALAAAEDEQAARRRRRVERRDREELAAAPASR